MCLKFSISVLGAWTRSIWILRLLGGQRNSRASIRCGRTLTLTLWPNIGHLRLRKKNCLWKLIGWLQLHSCIYWDSIITKQIGHSSFIPNYYASQIINLKDSHLVSEPAGFPNRRRTSHCNPNMAYGSNGPTHGVPWPAIRPRLMP
jgi:hypothetical protein